MQYLIILFLYLFIYYYSRAYHLQKLPEFCAVPEIFYQSLSTNNTNVAPTETVYVWEKQNTVYHIMYIQEVLTLKIIIISNFYKYVWRAHVQSPQEFPSYNNISLPHCQGNHSLMLFYIPAQGEMNMMCQYRITYSNSRRLVQCWRPPARAWAPASPTLFPWRLYVKNKMQLITAYCGPGVK